MTTTMKTPLQLHQNKFAERVDTCDASLNLLPKGITQIARQFHRQIDGYKMSPLKSLGGLADMLGVGGIWVKDESQRLSLNSFKVLGGSFALYRFLRQKLGITDRELTLSELRSSDIRAQLGDIVFATATDGNHGRGVAWAATQLGFRSVVYVHEHTTTPRIKSIEKNGATVSVIKGNYDDAVRQLSADAAKNGWQVISDTSWEGYEDIPKWVMQGYTTLLAEAQQELAAQGIDRPTHVFVQAGVGALAASVIGYYQNLFGKDRPTTLVVEPENAACLYESALIGDGAPHSLKGELKTIMAGLACGDPSGLAWSVLNTCADYFIACPDYVSAWGMRAYAVPLAGDPFIVSGESGSVTLGALMFLLEKPSLKQFKEEMNLNKDSQVLLINTEGNTDPIDFRRVVWDGGTLFLRNSATLSNLQQSRCVNPGSQQVLLPGALQLLKHQCSRSFN